MWLAERGFKVHLIDPIPLHIEQARAASDARPDATLAGAEVGGCRVFFVGLVFFVLRVFFVFRVAGAGGGGATCSGHDTDTLALIDVPDLVRPVSETQVSRPL